VGFAEGMGIVRFGAGDGRRADACYEIFRASRTADDPEGPPISGRTFRGWLKSGWVGDPRETWLLEDDSGIGGWYLLELSSRDNPHLGREHRGHRLGLRLKLAMLERLAREESPVKRIVTSNGETNGHMISINETLGYYVRGKPGRSWELPAAQVKQTAQS
jgi:hypothetical protein